MIELSVVNPNACGIDVGTKSHYVSIGQNTKEDIKSLEYILKICEPSRRVQHRV